jgi:hypothetical protein
VEACRADIVALVGEGPYEVLVDLLEERAGIPARPHPALNPEAEHADR